MVAIVLILVFPTSLWGKTKQSVDNFFKGTKDVVDTYKETFDEETKYNIDKEKSGEIINILKKRFSEIDDFENCYYKFDTTVLSTYEDWNVKFYNDGGTSVCLYRGAPRDDPLGEERLFCSAISGKKIVSFQDNLVFYDGFQQNLDQNKRHLDLKKSGKIYYIDFNEEYFKFLTDIDNLNPDKSFCSNP